MAPRGPGDASAAATAPASAGRTTSAALRAVRPQPVRTSRRIDASSEQRRPYHPEGHDGPVPEHHVLRGTPGSTFEEEGIAQDCQHEWHDRQLEVDVATGDEGRLLEGPEAVGGDGDTGRHAPDEPEELLGVGPQRPPVPDTRELQLPV